MASVYEALSYNSCKCVSVSISRQQSKNIKTKMYRTMILFVFLNGCEI
jgi:hypothetical protein